MTSNTWDTADRAKIMLMAKELRSSSGTKTAILQGRNVSYIKGNKLVSYLTEKGLSNADATGIGKALLREGFTLKADLLDPKRRTLRPSNNNPKTFDDQSFYVWNFEGSTGMRNLLLAAIVLAFFGLVLFPVWPQNAKVGVWYVSMTLLLVLLGFIFTRLILFIWLYAFGIDFWILPNFFADDAGFWDSFKPLYSFHFSLQTLRETVLYRLAALAILISIGVWVYTQPTEFDEFVASQRAFVDELYEGTLLSDKSQKDKEQIDKVVPDMATVQKELDELERMSEAKESSVVDELLNKDGENANDDEDVADL